MIIIALDQPLAVRTKLGSVVMGRKRENSQVNSCNHISKDILSEKLENFWQIDTYGTLPKLNSTLLPPSQKRALNSLETTTVFQNDRFEIGLLWKKENTVLLDSRDLAVKKLMLSEKRFSKIAGFKELYEVMNTSIKAVLKNYQKMKHP